jgi:hypothetical protein
LSAELIDLFLAFLFCASAVNALVVDGLRSMSTLDTARQWGITFVRKALVKGVARRMRTGLVRSTGTQAFGEHCLRIVGTLRMAGKREPAIVLKTLKQRITRFDGTFLLRAFAVNAVVVKLCLGVRARGFAWKIVLDGHACQMAFSIFSAKLQTITIELCVQVDLRSRMISLRDRISTQATFPSRPTIGGSQACCRAKH